MTERETARQAGEAAMTAIAPEADEFASLDMAGLGQSALAVLARAAAHPGGLAAATVRFWSGLARIGPVAAARWLGSDPEPPVPGPRDKRFADPAWQDNPAYFALRQAYLAVVPADQ